MKQQLFLVFALAGLLPGQTVVNGSRTFLGQVDSSQAQSTSPMKTGNGIPVGTCRPGQQYLQLDAPKGQNLWACTAGGSWSAQVSSPFSAGAVVDQAAGSFDDASPTVHYIFNTGAQQRSGYRNSNAFQRQMTVFNGSNYQDYQSGKQTFITQKNSMFALGAGQHLGEVNQVNCRGEGDCIAQNHAVVCDGGASQPGDEGCMALRLEMYGPTGNNQVATINSSASGACTATVLAGGVSTVNTNGSTVTRTGGNNFQNWLPGYPVKISGVTYTIQSVNSPGTLTLTTSAGTQSGVEMLASVIPQDDPAGGNLPLQVKVNSTASCLNEYAIFTQPNGYAFPQVFGTAASSDNRGYPEAVQVIAVDSARGYLTARFRAVHGMSDPIGKPRILGFDGNGVAAGQRAMVCDEDTTTIGTDAATVQEDRVVSSGSGLRGGGFTSGLVGGNALYPGSVSFDAWSISGVRVWVPIVTTNGGTTATLNQSVNVPYYPANTGVGGYRVAACTYSALVTTTGTGTNVVVDKVITLDSPFSFPVGHRVTFPPNSRNSVRYGNWLMYTNSPLTNYQGLTLNNEGLYPMEYALSVQGNYEDPNTPALYREGIKMRANYINSAFAITGKARQRPDRPYLSVAPGAAIWLATFPNSDNTFADEKPIVWSTLGVNNAAVLRHDVPTGSLFLSNSTVGGRNWWRMVKQDRNTSTGTPADMAFEVTNRLRIAADTMSRTNFTTDPVLGLEITVGHIDSSSGLTDTASVPDSTPTLSAIGAAANIGIALTPKGTGQVSISNLSGTGNAFACLDSAGRLFRSATACN